MASVRTPGSPQLLGGRGIRSDRYPVGQFHFRSASRWYKCGPRGGCCMAEPRPAADPPRQIDQVAPDRCPICGDRIRGIVAAGPGRHQFVDCGHPVTDLTVAEVADGRAVPVPAAGTVAVATPVEPSGSAGFTIR